MWKLPSPQHSLHELMTGRCVHTTYRREWVTKKSYMPTDVKCLRDIPEYRPLWHKKTLNKNKTAKNRKKKNVR